MSLRATVSAMSCSARSAHSRSAISQPTTWRLKISRITYRWKHGHLAGPLSFVMSHDQTWLGAIASNSGFVQAGWTSWLRRSRAPPRLVSTRYMVRTEPTYRPSSRSVACTAAGAVSAKRSLLGVSRTSWLSVASKANGGRGRIARRARGPTNAARRAWPRWRAGAPLHRPKARQAAPAPNAGVSSWTAVITASRPCRRSECPAAWQVFFELRSPASPCRARA